MWKEYMNLVNTALISSVFALTMTSAVQASGNQEEPLEYLIKFDIAGTPNQDGSFTIGGPGYSTVTTSSGEILDNIIPGLKKAQLTGALISFSGDLMNDPVIPFTCAAGTCTIEIGGSTLTSSAGVDLDGRVIPMWGPVINSNYKPDGSSTPLRILGCGGLKDISGEGKFANMVGSICFNGVFNLPDFQTNFLLTGGSNCTITMHTPAPGVIIP